MEKGVVEFLELRGKDALAGEKQRVGHFAEEQSQGEGGRGAERRAVEGGGESFGELRVGDRLRRDDVERAAEVFVLEHETEDGDGVVEGDPAHPLPAAGDFSSNSELKGPHHF